MKRETKKLIGTIAIVSGALIALWSIPLPGSQRYFEREWNGALERGAVATRGQYFRGLEKIDVDGDGDYDLLRNCLDELNDDCRYSRISEGSKAKNEHWGEGKCP